MADQKPYLLAGVRVLDLADEKGLMCGKLLGDFGADVIKIEQPGGDPARNIGPFYKDIPDPEKSLFWFFFNTSKRGITLDITKPDGKELFKRLVKTADVVVESFDPGYMNSLGLGYDDLCKVKPDIIMTSISPFGQTGPYAHYKGSDLVVQALGGFQYLSGDADRAPLRPGIPTMAAQSGTEAAAGTTYALFYRGASGEGQHVDVSMQLVAIWQMMNTSSFWPVEGRNQMRLGAESRTGYVTARLIWEVADGHVTSMTGAGPAALVSNRAWVKWYDEEFGAPQWLKDWDWEGWDPRLAFTDPAEQEKYNQVRDEHAKLLKSKTKKELWDRAYSERILLAPAYNVKDVAEWGQLHARGYYVKLEHPELGDTITYPGHTQIFSNATEGPRWRAPLIGEHNEEIYIKELGLSKQDLIALKQIRVI